MARPDLDLFFESKTIPDPNTGCLLWTGGADKNGYGKMYFNRRHRRVHTVIFELSNGPIPAGNLIQHTCDTPACCKLEHLRLGTPLTNMQDKVQKGRLKNQHMNKPLCKRGHEFSTENTYYWTRSGRPRRQCKICHKAGIKKRLKIKHLLKHLY